MDSRLSRRTIVDHWNSGLLIATLGRPNGSMSHDDIARQVGCSSRLLREYRRFYTRFPYPSKVCDLRIGWCALRECLSVPDPDERRRAIADYERNPMTVIELRKHLKWKRGN